MLDGIYPFVAALQILRSNIEFITLFLLGRKCCEMEILTVLGPDPACALWHERFVRNLLSLPQGSRGPDFLTNAAIFNRVSEPELSLYLGNVAVVSLSKAVWKTWPEEMSRWIFAETGCAIPKNHMDEGFVCFALCFWCSLAKKIIGK